MYKVCGYLNAGAEFATHADACNLFGHSYKQWYKAVARHPAEPDVVIWFPRFYENDEWRTWPSKDDETIYELRLKNNSEYVTDCLRRPEWFKRLVFPAITHGLYRFKGLYEIDPEASLASSIITYRRIASRVKTYSAL